MSSALDRINEYNKKKKEQYTTAVNKTNEVYGGVSALDRIDNYSKTHNLTLNDNNKSILNTTSSTTTGIKNEDGYTDIGKTYGDYWYQNYSKNKDKKIYEKDGQYYVNMGSYYQNVDQMNFMATKEGDEKSYQDAVALGYKGSKSSLTKMSDRIKLDTSNLSNKEYEEYEDDLLRQQEAKEAESKHYNRIKYGDALGKLQTAFENAKYNISKEIVNPIKNFEDNYESGKLNNQLALEYYKKMNGQENKVDELTEQVQKYNMFNQDLLTDPGMVGTAIQNLNTQVESLKNQGIAATALSGLGAGVGYLFGGTPGALAGAKIGGGLGYTLGATPYTYKLEAGNQYQTLTELGVPDDVAKKYSVLTGGANALIESGENIVDLITFGIGGRASQAVSKEAVDSMVKDYGENTVKKWLAKKIGTESAEKIIKATTVAGTSYLQNIGSEALEEMAQEGTSILGERLSTNEANIDRNISLKDDINRVLEAGKSAAISTAFTAPISSASGALISNTMNAAINKNSNAAKKTDASNIQMGKVENSSDIDYNTNKGDVYGQYENKGNLGESTNNDRGRFGSIQGHPRMENVYSTNSEGIVSQNKGYNIEQGYGTREQRQQYLNYANENIETNTTEEILEVQQIAKDLGVDLKVFKGTETGMFLGTVYDNAIYIDSNESAEHGNLKNRFYHEFLHYLKSNKDINFSQELNDIIKDYTNNNDVQQSINKFVESKGYDSTLLNDKIKRVIFEDVLADYSSKHLSGYDIEYNLPEELVYRLNTTLDDAITTMKMNAKKGTRILKGDVLPKVSETQETNIAKTLPKAKRNIPQDPTKEALPIAPKQNKTPKNYDAQKIANTINETIKQSNTLTVKQRRWIDTSTQSDVVDGKVKSSDLDIDKITYVVKSNKNSLENANNKLNNLGYEDSIKYVQSQLNNKNASTEDIVLAERLIQEAIKKGDNVIASELIMDTAILGTDLGQKVQALSLINRLTPEGQLKMLQKVVQREQSKGNKGFKDVEITPEMVNMILEAYNQDGTYNQQDLNTRVETVKQAIASQMKTTKMEKVDAWRYLSMLGNPKTHIRNIVSNVAMMGTIKVKNAMARTGEMLLPTAKRTKTWRKASDVVTNYAKQTAEEMKETITGEAKYSTKNSIESKKQIFKNKTLEKVRELNSKALEGEDWFFSKNAFTSSFKEYLTAQGIRTQQDIDNNPLIIEKAKKLAVEQAEIATFRQYSQLAGKISQLERNSKIAKTAIGAVLPFKKTPINVAKTGIKYSPLGLIKSVSYDAYQVKTGNMEASQMIDNMAQGLTGTSLALLGYALAKAGFLNGAGDDDKEGKYDSYLGTQSYSITIGNQNFALSWLSPIAMPLFIGANAYEIYEEQEDWNMNVVTDMLAKTLDPLSEMSFLSSLDSALSSYDSGAGKFMAIGENAVQSYIGQFFPTFFSQLASTLDDKKRTTKASNNASWKFGEETIRKIAYKIPGLRNQLEVSTDIWGNEIEQSENIITRAIENFISPATRKEDILSRLDTEIKKVYREVGDTGVIPHVPYGYIQYKDTKYDMSASEYTQYKKIYGQIAYEYLNKLINNSAYHNASYEEKSNMISKVYTYASDKAKQEYLKSQNITYTNSSEDNVDIYKDNSIVDAINNNISLKAATYKRNSPEKYATITIVTDYDTYSKYKEDIDEIKDTYKGTENTSIRKKKIFEYLNKQEGLSKVQKEILYGLLGGYSVKSYKNDIFNYINNQKGLTKAEKTAIWNYMYK